MLVGEVQKCLALKRRDQFDRFPTVYRIHCETLPLSSNGADHSIHHPIRHRKNIRVNLLQQVLPLSCDHLVGMEVDVSSTREWGNLEVPFDGELLNDPVNIGSRVVLICPGQMRWAILDDRAVGCNSDYLLVHP